MSINLMFQGAAPRDASTTWTAITAVSKADPASPFPNEGYVTVDADAIVRIAALLDGAVLANGETVTTHDFSRDADEDGPAVVDAHVSSFGPSLLAPDALAALRAELAPYEHASRMLDVVIAHGLQIALSSTDMLNRDMPYLKGVNWIADEVEIGRSQGGMYRMLDALGIPRAPYDQQSVGETPFRTFADAVETRGDLTDMPDRLQAFVACARRQDAATVYWA